MGKLRSDAGDEPHPHGCFGFGPWLVLLCVRRLPRTRSAAVRLGNWTGSGLTDGQFTAFFFQKREKRGGRLIYQGRAARASGKWAIAVRGKMIANLVYDAQPPPQRTGRSLPLPHCNGFISHSLRLRNALAQTNTGHLPRRQSSSPASQDGSDQGRPNSRPTYIGKT